jgi:hypothetical protein
MTNEKLGRAATAYRYKMMEANKLHNTAWQFFAAPADKVTFDAILARKNEYLRAAHKIWNDAIASEYAAGKITEDDTFHLDPDKYAYSTNECKAVQNIFGGRI